MQRAGRALVGDAKLDGSHQFPLAICSHETRGTGEHAHHPSHVAAAAEEFLGEYFHGRLVHRHAEVVGGHFLRDETRGLRAGGEHLYHHADAVVRSLGGLGGGD